MVNSQRKFDLKDFTTLWHYYIILNEKKKKKQLQQDRQFKNKKSMKSKTNHPSQN